MAKITWTQTDEAPALASHSLLPIVRAYAATAGIDVDTADISLAGRIAALFPERLTTEQRVDDELARLGEMALTPEATIIKLPNISASVPQLKAAISELQKRGYDIPDYPETPASEQEREVAQRYARVLGSAVNPVLRQGNSDRRAPAAVKDFARRHPHRLGAWSPDSRARVAHMSEGDFFGHEQSVVIPADNTLAITFTGADGEQTLADSLAVTAGEIVDGTFLSIAALRAFYAREIGAAKAEGLLWSLHLKATMMKVSDPVLFGHAVEVFYEDVFAKHGEALAELDVNPNLGMRDLLSRLDNLPAAERQEILDDIDAVYAARPAMAMVDSDRGITNLHAPNDIIIDASMPVVVRDAGKMWNPDGELHECIACIPDRSYAPIYDAIVRDCQKHGALDPETMGDVPNVGLMAQKAEEYGSHPTTFLAPGDGTIAVTNAAGETLMSHDVAAGDIWRMSRVKDIPVRDWVKLAVNRARATGAPAVFWLDAERAHDVNVIVKVREYLTDHNTDGLTIEIMAPDDAMRYSLERIRRGEDTISVTGNVLRDYLTDLFPILEIGTSAKMLSVVPLLNGGGLFETGAGGSAPKHVQQFEAEGYLRWDSLGEFSALGAALEYMATRDANPRAQVLADALDRAIGTFLDENKSPARSLGQIDNRGSHYYLALYWAEELAAQDADAELRERFAPIARDLRKGEEQINAELIGSQGQPMELGGYFRPDDALASAAMRTSPTMNAIIDAI